MIIKGRFPVPRLVVCDQHGSQVCDFYTLYVAFAFCHLHVANIQQMLRKLVPFSSCKLPGFSPRDIILCKIPYIGEASAFNLLTSHIIQIFAGKVFVG
jgi:hypothetical protein